MSKKDKTNFLLDFLKVSFFSLLVALFGIFGSLGANVRKIDLLEICIYSVGIVFIFVAMFFILRSIKKLLDELEKM